MTIEQLVYKAVFSQNLSEKKTFRSLIRKTAGQAGIYLASINNLYRAFGSKKISGFTVPAINIRTLTYDTAKIIFELMLKYKIGPVIFEIARSEIGYTDQQPDEYTTCILAGAVASGYKGPVFIQGDHYQFKAKIFKTEPKTEIEKIKKLIKDSIEAGFYNIDIDASTLVDLNKSKIIDQQKNNFEMTALVTQYIRSIEPKNIIVSIGGEIGHIGGKNSTVEEFEAFMKGYLKEVKIEGISKVSVQTGTSHGGIPLPDGTVAKVSIDFNVLKDIGEIARKKYCLGGPVQHGASTLPNELFNHFPKSNVLEIHLATGFQNIVYDNMNIPLKKKIYNWIKNNLKDEWKEGQTEDQFIYKTRKKALGPFKHDLWRMPAATKKIIIGKLKKQFLFLFKQLNIINTRSITDKYV